MPPDAAATPADRLALYGAAFLRHWRLCLAIVAVALAAGLLAAGLTPKSYDATAKVLIGQQGQVDALRGTDTYAPDPERDLNTGLVLITEDPIVEAVRRQLRLTESPAALAGRVSAAFDGSSSVVSVTARDADPDRAAEIANAFAYGYRDFRTRTAKAAIEDAMDAARARLEALPPGAERTELEAQMSRLGAAAAFETGGVQIVRRASAPGAPSRPRPLVSGLVAAVLGTLLAALVVVILARTDKRLHARRDLEAVVGRPVLATVPAAGGGSAGTAQEALLALAVRLAQPGQAGDPPAVLLLTSPGPGEGTADVALGLAAALASIGRRTIVIEADLRAPVFARRLGADPAEEGLRGVIAGHAALERELLELAPPEDRDHGGAWALPAGSGAGPAVLTGERAAAVVEDARRRADVVLLAAAPAGRYGDPLALVGLADTVVLVAALHRTRADAARRAVDALAGVGARVLGIVATETPAGGGNATPALEPPEPEAQPAEPPGRPSPARSPSASEATS